MGAKEEMRNVSQVMLALLATVLPAPIYMAMGVRNTAFARLALAIGTNLA